MGLMIQIDTQNDIIVIVIFFINDNPVLKNLFKRFP